MSTAPAAVADHAPGAGPVGAPGEPAKPTATRRRESGLAEYLIFLLGLVPVSIAVMRIVLLAQGDTSVLDTLLRTLNVPDLVIGTYGRYVGALGAGASLTVLLVDITRIRSGQPGIGRGMRAVAGVGLAASVACIYQEQVLDISKSGTLWPVDIVRAVAWAAVGYALVQAGALGLRAARGLPRHRRCWSQHLQIVVTTATVILLLWSYLLTNDRMWLPSEVITIKPPPPGIGTALPPLSARATFTGSARLANGDIAFVGYVLDQNTSDVTIITIGSRVIMLPAGDLAGRLACQLEGDFDPGVDRPLLFLLPPARSTTPRQVNPTCQAVISALTRT